MSKFIIIGCGSRGCFLADKVVEVLKEKEEREGKKGLPKNIEFIFLDSDFDDNSSESPKRHCKNINVDQLNWIHLWPNSNAIAGINWLHPDFKKIAGPGAGRRRMFGKALYFNNKQQIMGNITQYMGKIDDQTPKKEDWVFIILSTLSGGTGSSFFLDIALDIRDMIQRSRGNPPIIYGIGVLPMEDESNLERANAFASMKELHLVLSKGSLNPFSNYFIVGRQKTGLPVEELPECIARFVVDVLLGKDLTAGIELANLIAKLSDPSRHRFSTLGYNEVRFPVNMLSCYHNMEVEIPKIETELKLLKAKMEELDRGLKDKRDKLERLKKSSDDLSAEIKNFKKNKRITSRKHEEILENAERDIDINGINAKHSLLSTSINYLTEKLRSLERDMDSYWKKKEELDVLKRHIKNKLKNPDRGIPIKIKTISLNDSEIDKLRIPGIATECMYDLITKLGDDKKNNYISLTRDKVTGDLVTDPLLDNYKFFASLELDSSVLDYMLKYKFLEKDLRGEIKNDEEKLSAMIICVSTHDDNWGEGGKPLTIPTLTIVDPGNVEIRTASNPARLHSFAVYLLEAGLQPWAPSEGKPPRLTELNPLIEGYIGMRDKDMLARHSLFYDNPQAFRSFTGKSLSQTNPLDRSWEIVDFWQKYEIIDDDAKVSRIAVSIAKAMSYIDELFREINKIDVTSVKPLDRITTIALDTLIADLIKLRQTMDALLSESSELTTTIKNINSVKEALKNNISQLSSIQTTINTQKANNLMNMISDCHTKFDSLVTNLRGRIADLDRFSKELESLKSRYMNESPSEERIEGLLKSAIRNIGVLKEVAERLKKRIEMPIAMEDGRPGPLVDITDTINELKVCLQQIPTR